MTNVGGSEQGGCVQIRSSVKQIGEKAQEKKPRVYSICVCEKAYHRVNREAL